MIFSNRKFLILAVVCIALMLTAIAVKISSLFPNVSTIGTNGIAENKPPHIPGPADSFYETSPADKTSQGTSPKTIVPAVVSDGISARAYIVGSILTGEIYLQRNDSVVLPVASMSKLVTAIAATDVLSATTSVVIPPSNPNLPQDGSLLQPGEHFMVQELLYPMLLNSSNIAAESLASASSAGRNDFLEQMKSYAWEVGMPSAYFADASGIDPHNAASAKDIFGLAQYLYKFRPDILAITRVVHASTATTTDHGSHEFTNIHPFVNDPNFVGGKTGRTTEAGDTMMTILNVGDQPMAFIVLGSNYGRREADTRILIGKVTRK